MMLTELRTMDIKTHYEITSQDRYALAGNDCCKWHLKMKLPKSKRRRG